jgi:serine protease
MIKKLILILAIVSYITSAKHIITFKNTECEAHAFTHNASIFSESKSIKALKNIGMLIIDMDAHMLFNSILADDILKACVANVSADEAFKVEIPKGHQSNDKRKYWQLQRINVKSLPLPDTFTRKDPPANVKAHVYVIDSGIDGGHPDFAGKLAPEDQHYSFVEQDDCCDVDSNPLCDCAEHGTHCSGLITSTEAGYNTKAAILHAIKVFDKYGQTTFEVILSGMDKAIELKKANHDDETTIASMSLGGPYSLPINQAITKMVQANIFVVVAAGNSNKDSCTGSPSSSTDAFTIGASDIDDSRAYFSEYGKCVDAFAPGVDIYSCKPGGSYQYMSGTSMATPFFAGFASYIAVSNGLKKPDDIRAALKNYLTLNVVTNSRSVNNNLPYDGASNFEQNLRTFLELLN